MTSNKQDWRTPEKLFSKLRQQYDFGYDMACDEYNCLCDNGFTEEDDSLSFSWWDLPGVLWLNPPYGRTLKLWVSKCAEEAIRGARIVMLIPARPDTSYWHDYILNNPLARVEFLRGRLKFSESKNSAPFPSALIYWGL